MNLLQSGARSFLPATTAGEKLAVINIYHLHPLAAGRLDAWPETFKRVAAMGFSHVCLAPPFEPGNGGDIFLQ
jgi:hypothetical protein